MEQPTSPSHYHDVEFAPQAVQIHHRADGTIILQSAIRLEGPPRHICTYFEKWAIEAPDRTFIAERSLGGEWRHITYQDAWARVRSVGQSLLDLGLGKDRPIAILTGNSIEQAILTFGAMLARVPVAPVSPAYSVHPEGIIRLTEIMDALQPALVFAQTTEGLDKVRAIPMLSAAKWVSVADCANSLSFATLETTAPGPAIAEAFASADGDDIGKILFTSGSTGSPKGVPQSQSMLCAAVHGVRMLVPGHEAPVQVDWMPWHHIMGGNSTLHGNLRDGGTLYIDDGRPTPQLFDRTIRNLKEIPVTVAQYVPTNIQMLVDAMERDEELAVSFFKRISWLSYGGAALSVDVWRRLQQLSQRINQRPLPVLSGYGTTETAPGISVTHWPIEGQGEIGLPLPGLELKLVPTDDRLEVRVRGTNVMSGYLGRPDLTKAAFDDEGFYVIGDAVSFVDPTDPRKGLRFAGRLGENFKLTNGTWVITGELRTALLAAAPAIKELVVAGHGQDDIRLLVWAAGGVPSKPDRDEAGQTSASDSVAEEIAQQLRDYNRLNKGATRCIRAFAILGDPPSLGAGEVTDKGSVNQRAVLARQAPLVDDLYSAAPSPRIHLL